jgi:hypothetical protein
MTDRSLTEYDRVSRRGLLATGGGGIVLLAGCSGPGAGDDGEGEEGEEDEEDEEDEEGEEGEEGRLRSVGPGPGRARPNEGAPLQ